MPDIYPKKKKISQNNSATVSKWNLTGSWTCTDPDQLWIFPKTGTCISWAKTHSHKKQQKNMLYVHIRNLDPGSGSRSAPDLSKSNTISFIIRPVVFELLPCLKLIQIKMQDPDYI